MEVAQLKKLKEMETELAQYKRIVAEQSLQIVALKDVIEKKLWGLPTKRELVQYATDVHGISVRQAIKTFSIQPSVYYYMPKPNDDAVVREQLAGVAKLHNPSLMATLDSPAICYRIPLNPAVLLLRHHNKFLLN